MDNNCRPERLKEFAARHRFFIGIDSDGCVFDTMEIKQKECFVPVTIEVWGLQAITKYARETVEFVNLYSKWRGCNRFIGLALEFDLLAERKEVKESGIKLPDPTSLKRWIDSGAAIGNPALKEEAAKTGDPTLLQALAWSEKINQRIAELVHGIPPFPHVRQCMEKIAAHADIMVVSATPAEALEREWRENALDNYPSLIAGQEMGAKKDQLLQAASGKYEPGRILMVGDALGDLRAAREAGALFYPINPGSEASSWERFLHEGSERFLNGNFTVDYERGLIEEFERLLPDTPPWKRRP